MKSLLPAVAAIAVLAICNQASAQSNSDVLQRLEALEKSNAKLQESNLDLKKENAALRDRVKRVESARQMATAPPIAQPSSAAPTMKPAPGYAGTAPVYKATPIAVPAPWTWTGPYVGAFGGYGWGVFFPPVKTDDPSNGAASEVRLRGGFGGVQAGYNLQVAPHWLLGVEQDIWAGKIAGTQFQPPSNPTINTEINYGGTVRGRFGYVWDRALLYSTAGILWAVNRIELDFPPGSNNNNGASTLSQTHWHFGVVLGEGIEVAVLPDVSVKAEYLFQYLTKEQYFSATSSSDVAGMGVHTVRVGVNWLFH
jgi:outer membrane immunogenic protein